VSDVFREVGTDHNRRVAKERAMRDAVNPEEPRRGIPQKNTGLKTSGWYVLLSVVAVAGVAAAVMLTP